MKNCIEELQNLFEMGEFQKILDVIIGVESAQLFLLNLLRLKVRTLEKLGRIEEAKSCNRMIIKELPARLDDEVGEMIFNGELLNSDEAIAEIANFKNKLEDIWDVLCYLEEQIAEK